MTLNNSLDMKHTLPYTPPLVEWFDFSAENTMTTLSYDPDNNTQFFGYDDAIDL